MREAAHPGRNAAYPAQLMFAEATMASFEPSDGAIRKLQRR